MNTHILIVSLIILLIFIIIWVLNRGHSVIQHVMTVQKTQRCVSIDIDIYVRMSDGLHNCMTKTYLPYLGRREGSFTYKKVKMVSTSHVSQELTPWWCYIDTERTIWEKGRPYWNTTIGRTLWWRDLERRPALPRNFVIEKRLVCQQLWYQLNFRVRGSTILYYLSAQPCWNKLRIQANYHYWIQMTNICPNLIQEKAI